MYKKITSFLVSSFGLALLALAIDIFSWHNKLVTGGLPGWALVLNYLTGVSVGSSLLIANTVVLLLLFLVLGKSAGIKGVYGYVFLSVAIEFWRKILGLSQTEILLPNQILMVTFQGIIAAFAVSLIMSNNYSFGNYSTIQQVVNRFIKVSPPVFFFLGDITLSLLTIVCFGWQKGFLVMFNSIVYFFVFRWMLARLRNKN